MHNFLGDARLRFLAIMGKMPCTRRCKNGFSRVHVSRPVTTRLLGIWCLFCEEIVCETYVGTFFTSIRRSILEACFGLQTGFFLASVSERKLGYAPSYPDRPGMMGRTPICVQKQRPELESVVWDKLASALGLLFEARRLT